MELNQSKRIVVIDGDAAAQAHVKEQITKIGFEPVFIIDPSKIKGVLEMKFSKDKPFGFLIDIILPQASGFTLARELSSGRWGNQTPVMLMSKYNSPEDRMECHNAGALIVFQKPIKGAEIAQFFEKLEMNKLKAEISKDVFKINNL